MVAVAETASAARTLLYLRVAGGVRSLSLTAPTESSANPVCPGGSSGCTQGCAYVKPEGDLDCGHDISDPATLAQDQWTRFTYVTPEAWGRDPGASQTNPTGFSYYAGFCGPGTWAQPALRITYVANDGSNGGAGSVVQDIQGVPCPNCQSTKGCQIDTFTDPLQLVKSAGGNISTASHNVLGLLPLTLPVGSTIIVDVWNANGQAPGILYSYATKQSYIDVPYSKSDLSIRGALSPQYLQPGVARTFTFTLDNSLVGSPTLTKLEITIPGQIAGTTLYFASVSDPPSVSDALTPTRTVAGTTVVQAAGLPSPAQGKITIDFGFNTVAGSTVYVTFTATAPVSTIQSIRWDAVAYSGTDPYPLADLTPDSFYTAVLRPPPPPSGLTVVPQNVDAGGQGLKLTWTGPADPNLCGITSYVVYRPTYTQVATVPPLGAYQIGNSSWDPTTRIVTQVSGLSWTDGSLVNGQCYCYAVASANPVGQSALSATYMVCATPYAAPSVPASVTAGVASGRVRLDWDAVNNGTYATAGYEVWRSSCAACSATLYQTIPVPTVTYNDNGLSNSASYRYVVVPYDVQGHRSGFTGTVTGRPAVNPPSWLTPKYDYASSGVWLNWLTSTANLNTPLGYNVYRSECYACSLVKLGGSPTVPSITATVYLDMGVTVAKLYYYAVSALTNESGSTEGPMTAPVKILVPPAAPLTLTVLPAAGNALQVQWAIAPNAIGNVDGYKLFRATYAGVPTVVWVNGTVSQTSTTITDSSGLSPGIRYYYRVTAFLQRGDYAESPPSPEVAFVVEPGAPTWLTDTPGDTTVRITWSNTGLLAQEVDHYNVYRASWSAALPFVFVGSTAYTFYDDPGVVNGFRYYYRVTAANAGGEGPPVETTVGAIPYRPPGAPGPLAGCAWRNRAYVAWGPAIPTTHEIAAYQVWRSAVASGAETLLAATGVSVSFYSDPGAVIIGNPYYYEVFAVDTEGNRSNPSNEVMLIPAIPPCPPSSLSATVSLTAVDLSWPPVDKSSCSPAYTLTLTGYGVYRSTFSGGGFQQIMWTLSSTAPEYIDTTVTTGLVYYYAIRSGDNWVPPNQSVSATVWPYEAPVYSPQVLAAPRNPAGPPLSLAVLPGATYEHDGAVKLTWQSAVPGSFDVIGYDVFRSTTVGGPETHFYVSGWAADTFLDTGLTNKKYYGYRVVSVEENGFAGGSAALAATAYRDPNPPGGLTLAITAGQVVLSWTAAVATTYPVTGYRILRATFPDVAGAVAVSPDPCFATTLTDTTAAKGALYFYHVQTYDQLLHLSSGFSNEASGTPFDLPQTPGGFTVAAGSLSIGLSWNAATAGTYGISGYAVFRASYSGVACGGPPFKTVCCGMLEYLDPVLNDGKFWFYRVAAFDSVSTANLSPCTGVGSASAYLTVNPPGAAANLAGTGGDTRVDLGWQAGTMGTFPVSGYAVFRTTYAGNPAVVGAFEQIANTWGGAGGTAYADQGVTNGWVYYYRVRTRDNAGSPSYSVPSNEAVSFVAKPPPGLAGVPLGQNRVWLSWSAPAVPGPLQVTAYRIWRGTGATGPFTLDTVTLDMANLTATVYAFASTWYRMGAVHEGGRASGLAAAVNVVPLGGPAAPVVAADPGDASVFLWWSPVAGYFPPVTTFVVYRGTFAGAWSPKTTKLATLTGAPPGPTIYLDAAAANGTPAYYRIAAIDSSGLGASAYSNEAFGLPLGIATGMAASPGDSKVFLRWTRPAVTAGISGYFVYRRSLTEAEAISGTAWGATATAYQDAPVVNGTLYYYRVAAFDGSAPPRNAGDVSATVTVRPGLAPSAPTITGVAPGNGRIGLVWSPPSVLGSSPLSWYWVFRSSAGGGYARLAAPVTASFFTDTPLPNGITFTYQVVAQDTGGVEGPPSNAKSATPYVAPNPPGNLAVQLRNGSLLIGWSTVYLSGSSTVFIQTTFTCTGFQVFRCTSSNQTPLPAPMLTSATTYYLDTGLVNGTTYFYKVATVDRWGHVSSTSLQVSGVPYAPPGAPQGLAATLGNLAVVLTWRPGTAGTWTPLSGYLVYRGLGSGSETFLAGPVYSTLYVDSSSITNGLDYWYFVRARDALGNTGAASAEAHGIPSGSIVNPPTLVTGSMGAGGMTVSWGRTAAGEPTGGPTEQYVILRSTCASCSFAASTTSTYVGGTTFSWTDTTAVQGLYYRYTVRSVALAFGYAESLDYPYTMIELGSACGPPNAPASIVATAGSGAVSLEWQPPSTTFGCQRPLSYRLARSADAGATWLTVTTTGDLVYLDTTAVNGTAYLYRVFSVAVTTLESLTGATSQSVTPAARASSAYLSANAFAPVRGDVLEIAYTMDQAGPVSLRIFTISGLKVYEKRIDNQAAGPPMGTYYWTPPGGSQGWDGRADDGKYVASGVYLLMFEAGSFKRDMKVIVIK